MSFNIADVETRRRTFVFWKIRLVILSAEVGEYMDIRTQITGSVTQDPSGTAVVRLTFIEQTQTVGAACCRDDMFVNSIRCIKSVSAENVFTLSANSGFA
jgi:hypothetical protein